MAKLECSRCSAVCFQHSAIQAANRSPKGMNDKIGLWIVSWTILEADLLHCDGGVAEDAVGPDPGETLQAGHDARLNPSRRTICDPGMQRAKSALELPIGTGRSSIGFLTRCRDVFPNSYGCDFLKAEMVSRGSIVVAKNRHSISRVLLCPPVAEIKLLRMNTLLCILLAFMVPVAAAQILFQAGTGEEEIKGKPKQVRLERQEFRDEKGDAIAAKTQLVEVTDYRTDGKVLEHRAYRPDGTVSIREVFEYDDQGRRTKISSYDEKNSPVHTQSFHWIEAGVEEETESASDGKQRERTIRRFDEHGRMMELKSVDSDKAAVQMTLRYDDLGRPVEGQVTFKSENGLILGRRICGFCGGATVG